MRERTVHQDFGEEDTADGSREAQEDAHGLQARNPQAQLRHQARHQGSLPQRPPQGPKKGTCRYYLQSPAPQNASRDPTMLPPPLLSLSHPYPVSSSPLPTLSSQPLSLLLRLPFPSTCLRLSSHPLACCCLPHFHPSPFLRHHHHHHHAAQRPTRPPLTSNPRQTRLHPSPNPLESRSRRLSRGRGKGVERGGRGKGMEKGGGGRRAWRGGGRGKGLE